MCLQGRGKGKAAPSKSAARGKGEASRRDDTSEDDESGGDDDRRGWNGRKARGRENYIQMMSSHLRNAPERAFVQCLLSSPCRHHD